MAAIETGAEELFRDDYGRALEEGLVETPLADLMRRHAQIPATRVGRGSIKLGDELFETLMQRALNLPDRPTGAFEVWLWRALSQLQAQEFDSDLIWKQELEKITEEFKSGPRNLFGIQDEVVLPQFQKQLMSFRTEREARKVHPYRIYVARLINTRPNHEALHRFVFRAGSKVERVVVPPNGWNCYCRVVPVSVWIVQRRGWVGEFPLGTAQLRAFTALGGPDKGFPKSAFIPPA